MIRLFHVYFPTRTLLLAAAEVCLIVLAFLSATFARLAGESGLWLNYEHGFLKVAFVSFVLVLCMYYYDLYDSIVLGSLRETLARLVQVLGTVCVILALLYFLFPEVRLGRGIFLMGIGLVGLLLGASRNLFLALNRSSRLADRAVVVGGGSLAMSLGREIEKRPELGIRLLGFVCDAPEFGASSNGLRRLGGIKELPALVQRENVTRVIVAENNGHGKLPVAKLLRREKQGALVLDGAQYYEIVNGKVFLDLPQPSLPPYSAGYRVPSVLLFYKRVSSLILSLLGLVLSFPFLVLIALAIRLESKGAILFRQERVGKDGRFFTLYKFRTMRSGTGSNGDFKPTEENDERCTRLGRWLRRTHVDELPQLYNILRGEMYFVGPRPFAREEEERLVEQIPFYTQRWMIKPGATGWAQVQRGYCASVEDNMEKLSYDLFYIKNMSMGLDLLIFLQTTKILLLGRGAR